VADVSTAQHNDPVIQRVLQLKKNYNSLPQTVKQRELIAVQQLLHE
jgi:hypothetical protein